MSRQILGKVSILLRGEYSASTTYAKLDVVTYQGESYIAKTTTIGNLPTNTEYWDKLVAKPIKGTDYYTIQEKNEIEQEVIDDVTAYIPDVSNFITKDVNNLTYYTLKTATGSLIDLEINSTTYVLTLKLKDVDGNIISTDSIDLPLETVVVGGSYDSINQKIVLTLQNGNTVDIPVGALVAGLQSEITSSNKLSSDLIDDTNSGNKFVTTSEKQIWNGKGTYSKPNGGIPSTDMTIAVQTSLTKADNALPASKMVVLSQAEYDALTIKDSDTFYFIPEE